MGSTDPARRPLVVLIIAMMLTGGLPAMVLGGGAPEDRSPPPLGAAATHQWPMFARDSSHSGLADIFPRGITNPGEKWDRNLVVSSHATVMGNFTGNVVATNSSRPWDDVLHCAVFTTANRVYAVEGEDGDSVWMLNLTGTFNAAPALGDVDGDGRTDVMLATRGGVLYGYEPVIRWNGEDFHWWANNTQLEQLWNTTGESVGTVSLSNLALDDLNGNGTPELMVGSSQGVYCLNARYGNELWNYTVSGYSVSTPAVYELGGNRNVVATSFNSTPVPDDVHVYTLQGTTGNLIRHVSMEVTVVGIPIPPYRPPTFFFPSPVTADLDGQGDGDEIVIIQPYEDTTGRIIVFEDGELSWNSVAYNKSLGGGSGLSHICHATPAVGDLDGDSTLEVVVVSWRTYTALQGTDTYTNLSVFEGITGVRRLSMDIDVNFLDPEWTYSSPVLLDVDKDGYLDPIVLQYTGRMHAVSGKNGTILWSHNTRGSPTAQTTTSPAVGDLDQDGFPEIVVNGQSVSILLPDLEITADDIALTDPLPEEGETVGIDVLVHNEGNEEAEDVLVSVWDGDVLVGNESIAAIVAGSSYSARIDHEFYGRIEHTITVKVDPLGDIVELREDNNNASIEVTIVSRYGVAIRCDFNETVLQRGMTFHYFCDVKNLGIHGNRIEVTHSQPPLGWTVTFEMDTFTLGARGSPTDEATFYVEVKTSSTASAGEYPIIVTATSLNETRNNDSVTLTTVISGEYGVHLSPSDARRSVAPGDAVVYKFNATNIGNSVDTFDLEAIVATPQGKWRVYVHPPRINGLGPDESRAVSLSVSAPTGAQEGESLTVFVNIESLGDPAMYDESKTVTTVVVPDIAVVGLRYLREDGSEVDGSTKRLIQGETSHVAARVANLKRNVDITNLKVHFEVDGTLEGEETGLEVPADGEVEVVFDHVFTVLDAHTVRVVADPYESISDANTANNAISGTVRVKDPSPEGSYEIIGKVFLPDGVTPVARATVQLTVESSGYSFSVIANEVGEYIASLADTQYVEGDAVTVNATDGRDHAEETVHAYSEDGGVVLDLVLEEGVHFDVELALAQTEIEVDTGEEVKVDLLVTSEATQEVEVDLSVQASGWSPAILDGEGTEVTNVTLAMGGSVGLKLRFRVPDGAKGGTNRTFVITATSRGDPGAVSEVNLTATVRSVREFSMVITPPTDPSHPGEDRIHLLNLTNLGNTDDEIDLVYESGFTSWNVSFERDPVTLPAFNMVVVRVYLTVPEGTPGGSYEFAVTGVSNVDPEVLANAYVKETVEEPFYDVTITTDPGPKTGGPEDKVRWSLTVLNTGNVGDDFDLRVISGLDASFGNRFIYREVERTRIHLDAGESKNVILEVDIPARFSGTLEDATLDITVKATSVTSGESNTTVVRLEIQGLVDLSLDFVTVSTLSPKVGDKVTITVSVKNLGPDDAERVWLAYGTGDDMRKVRIGDIKAGETVDKVIEWIAEKEGKLTMRFVLNPEDETYTISETSRDNNNWSEQLDVGAAGAEGIWNAWTTWLLLIIIIIVVAAAAYYFSGGGGEEPLEAVEVVEEPEGEDEEEGDEEAEEGPKEEAKKVTKAVEKKAPPKSAPAAKKAPAREAAPKEKVSGKGADDDLEITLPGGRL